jgi:hypothetical protein
VQVDGISKGDVIITPSDSGYRQITVVEGLNNTYHTLELTVSSGSLEIDKVVMGSPTEIPEMMPEVPENYYSKASYNRPWIFQDPLGVYWITMEVQSLNQYGDIYITSSKDGVSWSKPRPVVTGIYHEYDSATVVDGKGEFWMVFTRIEPVANKRMNTPYYTHSVDGINWDKPKKIIIPQDNAYYPYLYYDAEDNSFIYLYASGSVEDGEYHDNIYIATTQNLDELGNPLKITDNSMISSYYPTLIKDADGEFWLYFVSPLLEDETIFANHNDIFVMHSADLKKWSAPSLVTDGNKSVAYNYLHPAYKDGVYYLAIMSSQVVTEDAYIMRSEDGINFTSPERMVDHDDENIIDYKSMTVDKDGVLWMAYSHVTDNGSRVVYVVNSSDGINWSEPIRVSPPSNIFGELWLESEPKPESVLKLEAELESGKKTSQPTIELNEADGTESIEAQAGKNNSVPQSGFNTALIAVFSILFLAVAKRRR